MSGMVIIGAGECGVRAAFALREHGYDGSITLIGAEADLPYERPPLSKARQDLKPIRPADAYTDARIDLRLAQSVETIDREAQQVALASGERIPYDRLLIATGARARVFAGLADCLTLRTAADADAIRAHCSDGARIGIIGGGFIGLELAAMARLAGASVTVIETAPRLLARAVPALIAEAVQQRHEAEGVVIRLNTAVASADATTITLGSGEVLEFDAVIAGVGAEPNTALAEQAGLEVANGIVVDATLRTSDPDIFAAGDCCNFPYAGGRIRLESWKAAQDQGAHAAAAMLGHDTAYGQLPWFWSDQYDLTLQVAGLFDVTLPIVIRSAGEDCTIVVQNNEDGTLRAAAGIGPGNAVAKDLRILEKLIERGARVESSVLADPSQNLKRLLKAA